jgi:hypothetical protein
MFIVCRKNLIFIIIKRNNTRGGFSVLVRGVADSEPKIFATPLQGGGKFYKGVATINPLVYKHRAV